MSNSRLSKNVKYVKCVCVWGRGWGGYCCRVISTVKYEYLCIFLFCMTKMLLFFLLLIWHQQNWIFNCAFFSICVVVFSLLTPLLLFPFLASVSAHYVPTVCNGREIVDSTTSSLWPHPVYSPNLPPVTVSQLMNIILFFARLTHTQRSQINSHICAHTRTNKQTPSLWTRTVSFHICRKCVTIWKLFSRDVYTWKSKLVVCRETKEQKKFLGGIFGAFVFDSFVMMQCK